MTANDDKARLRKEARARRMEAFRHDAEGAARSLARHVMSLLENQPASTVAGYWAVGSEIDLTPLMNDIAEEGWNVALPVVVENDAPLIFRRWLPGDDLVEGPFKTLQPKPSCEELNPEIILTPLLAFDGDGNRLGQGAGFYDRTIARLRQGGNGVLAVGVCFSAQCFDEIPSDHYDQPLDLIITEKGRV